MTVEEWLQRVKKADDRVEDLKFKRQIALISLCGGAIDTDNGTDDIVKGMIKENSYDNK